MHIKPLFIFALFFQYVLTVSAHATSCSPIPWDGKLSGLGDEKYDVQSEMVSNQDGTFLLKRTSSGLHLFKVKPRRPMALGDLNYLAEPLGLTDRKGWDKEWYRWGVKAVAGEHEIYVVSHSYDGLDVHVIDTSDPKAEWKHMRTLFKPWGHKYLINYGNMPIFFRNVIGPDSIWLADAADASIYKSLKVAYFDNTLFAMLRTRKNGVEVYALPVDSISGLDGRTRTGFFREDHWRWQKLGPGISDFNNSSAHWENPAVYEKLQLLPVRFGSDGSQPGVVIASQAPNGITTHSIRYEKYQLENKETEILVHQVEWTKKTHENATIRAHEHFWDDELYFWTFQAASTSPEHHYVFLRGPSGMHAYFMSTQVTDGEELKLVYAQDNSTRPILADQPPPPSNDPKLDEVVGCPTWREKNDYEYIRVHSDQVSGAHWNPSLIGKTIVLLSGRVGGIPVVWEYKHDPNNPSSNAFVPQWLDYSMDWLRDDLLGGFINRHDPGAHGWFTAMSDGEMVFGTAVGAGKNEDLSETLKEKDFVLAAFDAKEFELEAVNFPDRPVKVRTEVSSISFDKLKAAIPEDFADDPTILELKIEGWDERFGHRAESYDHVQGIGMTIDGRFVASVELDHDCSVLLYSHPVHLAGLRASSAKDLEWEFDCSLKGDHPYAVAVAGEFVGIGEYGRTQFFKVPASGDIVEFSFQDDEGTELPSYEVLAMGFNDVANKLFILGGQLSGSKLQGYIDYTVYSHDLNDSGHMICSIEHVCQFEKNDDTLRAYASQGGVALIDIPNSSAMALFSIYADTTNSVETRYDEGMVLQEVDFSKAGPVVTRTHVEDDLGDTKESVSILGAPSARWGGSVAQLYGNLYMIWAGHMVSSDDEYEIAIKRIPFN